MATARTEPIVHPEYPKCVDTPINQAHALAEILNQG